jgi:2-methylisocitrate lyase-like PEP mutase family enzyme
MSTKDRTSAFRALHQRQGLFVMPNPWDVGTARMLETLGFEAIATASAALAFALGRKDGAYDMSRKEAIGHGKTLVDAVDLPVNGDLEAGYGAAPEEVAKTIRQAAAAGMAGCSIEDITGDPEHPLFDRTFAVERIEAAVQARAETSSDFVLTARCEAFLTGHPAPLDECVKRLGAMAEAGADVVYACGMHERGHIETLVREMPVPVNVIGGTGPTPLSLTELEAIGVKRVSLGPRMIQAALGGFLRAAEELREQGTFGFMTDAANFGKVKTMVSRAD